MPVEYYIQKSPEYSHELDALLNLAQAMRHAFTAVEPVYLLAANARYWNVQADAVLLAPHAIVLLELKSCPSPIRGDANSPWRTVPDGATIHGGSRLNPYHQVVATREV